MSTDLFRKYIDILKEFSDTDLNSLRAALTELEAVLAKYRSRIVENRLFEIDLSQMSREQIEALRQGGTLPPGGSKEAQAWHAERSAQSTVSQAELDALRASQPTPPPSPGTPGMGSKIKSGLGKIGKYGSYAVVAYDILNYVYNWLIKAELKDLAPGDQQVILKNIEIIKPFAAPNVLETLPKDLQTRLVTVVDLLGKLGMSMKPTPGTERKPDDINKALEKIQAVKEQDLAEFKKIILQNMHLLSESEQMAVHRALITEDWTNYAAAAMSPGGLASGAVTGAAGLAGAWAKSQAGKVAAEKAATDAAAQAAADALAAEQENARIIAQNAEAERQWRSKPPAARGDRPVPKALVKVPTIPRVEPANLNKLQKAGAAVGQHLNLKTAWEAAKKLKGWGFVAAAMGYGLYYLYDKFGAPLLSAYTGYKGAETGINSVKDTLRDLSRNPKKEAMQELTATIIKDIGTICGPEGGPEGCLTPEEFRQKYEATYSAETRKAIDAAVLDWCLNHPSEPGNNERARQICATYDNQLPGCNL